MKNRTKVELFEVIERKWMNQSNKDPFEKNIQNGINHNKNRYFKVEISKVVLINVIT